MTRRRAPSCRSLADFKESLSIAEVEMKGRRHRQAHKFKYVKGEMTARARRISGHDGLANHILGEGDL